MNIIIIEISVASDDFYHDVISTGIGVKTVDELIGHK